MFSTVRRCIRFQKSVACDGRTKKDKVARVSSLEINVGDDSKLAYINMDGFFFSSASMTTTAPSADTATPRVAFSTASNAWTAQCSIGSPPGLSALIQGPSAAFASPDLSTNW